MHPYRLLIHGLLVHQDVRVRGEPVGVGLEERVHVQLVEDAPVHRGHLAGGGEQSLDGGDARACPSCGGGQLYVEGEYPGGALDGINAAFTLTQTPTPASSLRLYRTFVLDEINQDYIRTARSKGLTERAVMFKHVLKNGMIPILTGVVVVIPSLFTGSLLTESFFGIPGLGSYTIDAINAQDFAVVRAMVFIGSLRWRVVMGTSTTVKPSIALAAAVPFCLIQKPFIGTAVLPVFFTLR